MNCDVIKKTCYAKSISVCINYGKICDIRPVDVYYTQGNFKRTHGMKVGVGNIQFPISNPKKPKFLKAHT